MRPLLAVAVLALLPGCTSPEAALISTTTLGFDAAGRGLPDPVPFDDCAAALETLNARVLGEAAAGLDRALAVQAYQRPRAVQTDAGGAFGGAAPEVTGTNNQELGADEADLVKTDGEWTYVLGNGAVHILRTQGVGDVELVHTVHLGVDGGQVLLWQGDLNNATDDRLLVLVQAPRVTSGQGASASQAGVATGASIPSAWWDPFTRIVLLDLADRSDPVILDDRTIEGRVTGARLIDDVAHVVLSSRAPTFDLLRYLPVDRVLDAAATTWEAFDAMNETQQQAVLEQAHRLALERNEAVVANLTLEDHLPEHVVGGQPVPVSQQTCARLLSPQDGTGRSIHTIWSLDVRGLENRTVQVLGSQPIVYAAPGALVLAERSQDTWWHWTHREVAEATNLHWFDLEGLDVVHRASGRIAGTVLDSFGLDVHDGQLRVVTTTGTWQRWWEDSDVMQNHLAVFVEADGRLVETGTVSGFAPGERVWSARFTEDRAYVVTFRQIDPLWIIDLEDPKAPRILGELEIPGVSTYLHPISDDRLLATGLGPRADGDGLDWNRIQVSLFDTSDPTRPSRLDVIDLPSAGWSWSEATREHKAFTYWDRLGMLALPLYFVQHERVVLEDGRVTITSQPEAALQLIRVEQDDLWLYGKIDQAGLEGWPSPIQRSHFLGFPDHWPEQPVSVYAVSQRGVTAHDLATLHAQGAAAFR